MLGIIGETIDIDGEHICGARIVDKSNGKGQSSVYRVELWLRTKDPKMTEQLKTRLIDVMTEGRGTQHTHTHTRAKSCLKAYESGESPTRRARSVSSLTRERERERDHTKV